jgi:predicted nucleic acid-binding protein
MEEFLQGFMPAFCDHVTCAKWAEASASARRNGRPIDAADAWIAATALQYGVPLVTHNPTHFLGVDGLGIISELTP